MFTEQHDQFKGRVQMNRNVVSMLVHAKHHQILNKSQQIFQSLFTIHMKVHCRTKIK